MKLDDEETVTVSADSDDLIVVAHTYRDLYNEISKDTLVIPRSAAGWVADRLDDAWGTSAAPPYDLATPPDQIRVNVGGNDQRPCVNILNRRDKAAPRGGASTVVNLSEGGSRELARKLREL